MNDYETVCPAPNDSMCLNAEMVYTAVDSALNDLEDALSRENRALSARVWDDAALAALDLAEENSERARRVLLALASPCSPFTRHGATIRELDLLQRIVRLQHSILQELDAVKDLAISGSEEAVLEAQKTLGQDLIDANEFWKEHRDAFLAALRGKP